MEKFNHPILNAPNRLVQISLVIIISFFSCSPIEDNNLVEVGEIYSSDANISNEVGAAELFVSGLQGASGSTIGPGGDLFVTEGAIGEISRINLKTGEVSTFASGLPPSIIGIGGVIDLIFMGETAYALVTLNGPQFGGSNPVGIYRIDGIDSYTVIADIGQFALDNPPDTEFVVEMGLQYSIEVFRDGFLVTDGHLNYVMYITLEGEISIYKEFGNIVPTGLDVSGHTIYMAEAGPVPHNPEDGKVVTFGPGSTDVTTLATGARLLVDVEFGRGRTLFALSQGIWDEGGEGSPALPNTGSLVKAEADGTFSMVVDGLDRPTSVEIVNNTAYILTLTGTVMKVENITTQPYGN
jgi:hypothetical protein